MAVTAPGASLGEMTPHTPPPRARSASPTVEPPLPPMKDEPTLPGRIVKRFGLEAWQFLAGLAFALAVIGWTVARWDGGKATVEQLDAAKTSFGAQLGAAQGATAVQLGALQGKVDGQGERLAKVEGRLDLLISMQQQALDQAQAVLDQARAIAKATGARVVPPPDPSHPPSGGLP